jgi:hypothetical protein
MKPLSPVLKKPSGVNPRSAPASASIGNVHLPGSADFVHGNATLIATMRTSTPGSEGRPYPAALAVQRIEVFIRFGRPKRSGYGGGGLERFESIRRAEPDTNNRMFRADSRVVPASTTIA